MKNTILLLTLLLLYPKLFAQIWEPLQGDVDFGSGCIKTMTTYNGNLIVGGSFTITDNGQFDRVAQWNGNQWTDVGGGIHNDINLFYGSDVVFLDTANNQLIAGGNFGAGGPPILGGFIKYDGENWSRFNDTILAGGRGSASCRHQDRLYVAGLFGYTSGWGETYPLAYIDTAGLHPIVSYIAYLGPTWDMAVHAMAYYDGAMYFGGQFDYLYPQPYEDGNPIIHHIARWDGETFTDVGGGLDGDVISMQTYNGELYVSGYFYNAGGVSVQGFAKWNGNTWQPVVNGISGGVHDMIVYDNKLFVGGAFGIFDGQPAANVVTFDGTNWQPLASSMTGEVNAFHIHNNQLYMAGCFTNIDGVPFNKVARYTIPLGTNNTHTPQTPQLRVYPNPAQQTLNIANPTHQAITIYVYNNVGAVVRQQNANQAITFNIADLPNGLYYTKINTPNGTQVTKIIKQ